MVRGRLGYFFPAFGSKSHLFFILSRMVSCLALGRWFVKCICQSLAKGCVLKTMNAVRADALRPVCVLSAWWRFWGRARLCSNCMATWISQWWPDDFYSGRQGVSASDALLPILQSVDEGCYVGSLDFSLAFDSADPIVPFHVFKRLGMPSSIASMNSKVWCHQERFLQLQGKRIPTRATSLLPFRRVMPCLC